MRVRGFFELLFCITPKSISLPNIVEELPVNYDRKYREYRIINTN